jgi:hypothetical protein
MFHYIHMPMYNSRQKKQKLKGRLMQQNMVLLYKVQAFYT